MSKMDNLRAMREARYERARATPSNPSAPRPTPAVAPAPVAAAPQDAPPDDEALCGHRSMNGRTCTRESGHAAKSHRYS